MIIINKNSAKRPLWTAQFLMKWMFAVTKLKNFCIQTFGKRGAFMSSLLKVMFGFAPVDRIGHSKIQHSNCNQSIRWHHHVKDHIEISPLTKFHAFKVNRDQVMDLETWFKIHTNFSTVETTSPETMKTLMISVILLKMGKYMCFHLSIFQMVAE